MEIPFEGQLTRKQLKSVLALAMKSTRWMSFVCGPSALFFAWVFLVMRDRDPLSAIIWIILSLFLGLFATYPFWGVPVSTLKSYNNPEVKSVMFGIISNERILMKTNNATQELKWTLYKKVVRDQNTVLLYLNQRYFHFFPRSFFATDADWQAFQSLLNEKVQRNELPDYSGKQDITLGSYLSRRTLIILYFFIGLPVYCFLIILAVLMILGSIK